MQRRREMTKINCKELLKAREEQWAKENPNATEEETAKAKREIADQVVKEVMKDMWKR
jgi:hypothetical protein